MREKSIHMKLKQLEVFVMVADCRSFSEAAKMLFLTQPTISAHIQSLERELNTKLIARNTKNVCLTHQGKQLYQYAREMLLLQDKILELFVSEERNPAKSLVIAASTIPSQYLLPDILAKFQEKYPHEQFEIRETDSGKVIEAVANHLADIGFVGTVLENKNCEYIPFYEDELTIIMPNTDKFKKIKNRQTDLKWIQSEPIIMREKESGTRKEAERILKHAGIDLTKLQIIANIENTELIKRSVKNGMGITIISKLAVREDIASGKVLAFPLEKKSSTRTLNLVYHKNFPLLKSAANLRKMVQEMYHLISY